MRSTQVTIFVRRGTMGYDLVSRRGTMAITPEERKERRKESLRRYNASAKGKATKNKYRSTDRYKETVSKYTQTEVYKKNKRQVTQRCKLRYPEKTKCRVAVNRRVAANKMPTASFFKCNRCSNTAQDYHHHDYSLWWSVEALCRSCHTQEHLPHDD